MPFPVVRIAVVGPLNPDRGKVGGWCDVWGMKTNASKPTTIVISMSRIMHRRSPPLTIGETVLKDSDDLDIFVVIFDSKMTFEQHLHSISKSSF